MTRLDLVDTARTPDRPGDGSIAAHDQRSITRSERVRARRTAALSWREIITSRIRRSEAPCRSSAQRMRRSIFGLDLAPVYDEGRRGTAGLQVFQLLRNPFFNESPVVVVVELGGIEPPTVFERRAWSERCVPGQAVFSSDRCRP